MTSLRETPFIFSNRSSSSFSFLFLKMLQFHNFLTVRHVSLLSQNHHSSIEVSRKILILLLIGSSWPKIHKMASNSDFHSPPPLLIIMKFQKSYHSADIGFVTSSLYNLIFCAILMFGYFFTPIVSEHWSEILCFAYHSLELSNLPFPQANFRLPHPFLSPVPKPFPYHSLSLKPHCM